MSQDVFLAILLKNKFYVHDTLRQTFRKHNVILSTRGDKYVRYNNRLSQKSIKRNDRRKRKL